MNSACAKTQSTLFQRPPSWVMDGVRRSKPAASFVRRVAFSVAWKACFVGEIGKGRGDVFPSSGLRFRDVLMVWGKFPTPFEVRPPAELKTGWGTFPKSCVYLVYRTPGDPPHFPTSPPTYPNPPSSPRPKPKTSDKVGGGVGSHPIHLPIHPIHTPWAHPNSIPTSVTQRDRVGGKGGDWATG